MLLQYLKAFLAYILLISVLSAKLDSLCTLDASACATEDREQIQLSGHWVSHLQFWTPSGNTTTLTFSCVGSIYAVQLRLYCLWLFFFLNVKCITFTKYNPMRKNSAQVWFQSILDFIQIHLFVFLVFFFGVFCGFFGFVFFFFAT